MGSLVKSAYKKYNKMSDKAGLPSLASLGLSFSLVLARYFLRRPGVRAYAEHLADNIFQAKDETTMTPARVNSVADAICRLFEEKGFKPARIAVDGVPGSGKSTLAQALADKLGMRVVCLDHQSMDAPLDFEQDNAIYEHHRLLRTQDIDAFDALVYIDEPVEISKKKVIKRKRGGYLVEVLDYDLVKRIGDKAFAFAEGESFSFPNNFVRLKLKPQGGFKDRENINAALRKEGFDGAHFSKEETLFLCSENRAKQGFKAYVNLHAFNKDALAALSETLLFSGKCRQGEGAARWKASSP